MSKLILTNPDLYPDDLVLKNMLKEKYEIFAEIVDTILSLNTDIMFNWKYYRDGKSWLCKVALKQKTIFWLSLWDDCIKVTFYFSGKKKDAFLSSDIKDIYKKRLEEAKPSAKICPLTFEFRDNNEIEDLAAVAALKIKLK